ncbi:50S ribosomal protein L25 [Patescibacteria group bacterium]|nr:50S ribosomal protein L25 [Patescibacteria group bacterium]
MAQKIKFQTQRRDLAGKKVGQLRRQGLIPGNINGDLEKTISVVVDQRKFEQLYEEVGDTGLFYVTVGEEKTERPVLITDVQLDPISATPLHVVFRQVDLTEKITAEVPVELIGEVEIKDAIVATLHDVVEVEALPQDLPEKFEIDISKFTQIGDMVTYKDLEFDRSKVSLTIDEEQLDEPVVMVQEVKEEVEPEPAAETVEGAEGAPAAGAEGEAAPAEAEGEKAE